MVRAVHRAMRCQQEVNVLNFLTRCHKAHLDEQGSLPFIGPHPGYDSSTLVIKPLLGPWT
jgi:hypothetical protein